MLPARSFHSMRNSSIFFLLLSAFASTAANAKPFTVLDCTAPSTHSVLTAPTESVADARAYWLDANTIEWPNLNDGLHVRLKTATGREQLQRSDAQRAKAFDFIGQGPRFTVRGDVAQLLRHDVFLEAVNAQGNVVDRTRIQVPGALDALYADAAKETQLGVTYRAQGSQFKLWAPTAEQVAVCLYTPTGTQVQPLTRDDRTGIWSTTASGDRFGQTYTYLVDVFMPGHGRIRNRVTDPYSISLNADSAQSWIGDMDDPRLAPTGWSTDHAPNTVSRNTDMSIYELHVRDFSRDDDTVPAAHRGKLIAFTNADSDGMRHLKSLAKAGLTDVHLLPIFDFATLPEVNCVEPRIPQAARDSDQQQAAIRDVRDLDCYNWGYEPYHFNAVEGSYATNPSDGAIRIREMRQAVMALHQAGLRVGMDVVYNHTNASGLSERSVFDRIVPGYYHRLDAKGVVERSTCCDNTATEHRMMGKLMIDSVEFWARHYRIDSFRFDLMAHQPRDAMEIALQRAKQARGKDVQFLGEGWNFGEIADGKRFVQASQLSLNGSGIGTFSDRARDAVRGGSAGDAGQALIDNPGFIHRRLTANDAVLWDYADWIRVGLMGSLRGYPMPTREGAIKPAEQLDYKGAPAAYVSEPHEVVNYVENHDNQTLFDLNAVRMPENASSQERVRAQWMAIAINAMSQGIAYYHAGIDLLRSKSLDRNSYNSGDWFNRIDWNGRTNYFGTGLPPVWDNEQSWPQMRNALNNSENYVSATQIQTTQRYFRDWLAIRASSKLFRMDSANDIKERLTFPANYVQTDPQLIVAHYDGKGLDDARFREAMLIINSATQDRVVDLPVRGFKLHPILAANDSADTEVRKNTKIKGRKVTVPAHSTIVLVR